MSRRLLTSLVLSIFIAACAPQSSEAIISDGDVEAEEYQVYSALIEEWYISERIDLVVIIENTETQMSAEWYEAVPNRLPDVSDDLVKDFREKNLQSYTLESRFDLKVECAVIDNQELEEIFSDSHEGWNNFYRRFPNSPGYIELSRVGFNSEMSKAFVSVGNQSHWRAGAGHLVLLV